MERRVVIGVDPGIVGEHVVHLVEAVGGREVRDLVADMPFAELHRRVVACFRYCAMVGVSLVSPFGSPGASTAESEVRMGIRPVMNEARPAVQLAWP